MPNYGQRGAAGGYGQMGGGYGDGVQTQDQPGVQLAPAMVAPNAGPPAPAPVQAAPQSPPNLIVVQGGPQPSDGGGGGGGGFFRPPGPGGGGGGWLPQFPQIAAWTDGLAKKFPWWVWLGVGLAGMWWLQSSAFIQKWMKKAASAA